MMPVGYISPAVNRPQGRQIAMPCEWVESKVRAPKSAAAKDLVWRWSFVEFRGGYRKADGLLREHGLMFDVDDGTTLEQLRAASEGVYTIIHSTFNASKAEPRWRVIRMLDRPIETEEDHERVWRADAMQFERVGGKACFGARSVAQCFAVPAVPPSGYYVHEIVEGAFVSVDEALATIPKTEPLPQPSRGDRTDSYSARLERAAKYLAKMPGAISGSHGHATTFKAAVAMVRGFALEPDDALRLLVEVHNPTCAPPWSERELVHKVRQAWQRARVPFGAIADRGRAA